MNILVCPKCEEVVRCGNNPPGPGDLVQCLACSYRAVYNLERDQLEKSPTDGDEPGSLFEPSMNQD